MKVLFYLGHPAHFQLYKNIMTTLSDKGHTCLIVIKKKDILEELVQKSGFEYINTMPDGKGDSKLKLMLGMIKRTIKMIFFCIKKRPNVLIGTCIELPLIGKVLGIPSINVEEDDAAVIPLYAKYSYPFSTTILTPTVCDNGKWNDVSVKYNSYHELAYLHPNHFTPNRDIVNKYFDSEKPYFLMRFVSLTAHHDGGIAGINADIASKIIELIKPYGDVYITSERPLESEFEKYRLQINPVDIHHVMAFSKMMIGDSQTMSAEAGVLGIPYIRFNDFVGRIGYLEELENVYKLGIGIKPKDVDVLYTSIDNYLKDKELYQTQTEKLNHLLTDKVDAAKFFVWFIENYPKSIQQIKENPEIQFSL